MLLGNPSAVSNAGSGEVNIGVRAEVGEIVSLGPVVLRNHARAANVLSGVLIEEQSGANISGVRVENAKLAPLDIVEFDLTFPNQVSGPIMIEPNGSRTLAPGNYSEVTVKRDATLRLSTGKYTFRKLDVQANGILRLSDASGPVEAHVRDELLLKGNIFGSSSEGQTGP